MREILFRGQTRRYGEKVRIGDGAKMPSHWVYGGVLQSANSYSMIYGGENVKDTNAGFDKYVVYTDTLGQFTGLADKNGKKIFEGDIIEWDKLVWGCPHRELVEWNYTLFSMRKDNWEEWCEVIGNIHDNPELLEE